MPAGGSGVYTYQWIGPNGFSSTAQSPVVPNATSASSGTYTVIVTDGNGCSAEASTVVDVTTGPAEPVIASSGSVCEGGQVILEIPAYSGTSVDYEWIGPAGSTTSGGYPNANYIEIEPATAAANGFYAVQVTVDGCPSLLSSPYELVINDLPTVVAGNDGTECVAPMTDLTLTATPSGGSGNYTYQWVGPNGFTSVMQNPVVPNVATASAGTYTVIIYDENGCSATASTVVDVTTGPAQPTVSATDVSVCEGEALTISTQNYVGSNVSYEWTGPLGTTSNGDYPNTPQLVIDQPTTADGGVYSVQVTVDGCASVASMPITIAVNEIPTVDPGYSYSLNPDCSPTDLYLFANATAGSGSLLQYQWTGPNGFASTIANPVISNITEQYNGSYTLIISDENGCSSSRTVEVSGLTATVAMPIITTSPQTCEGGLVTLAAPLYQGSSVSYTWNIPNSSANITGFNSNQLTIFPADTSHNGAYSVTVVVDGCELTSPAVEVVIFETPTVVAANDGTDCIAPNTDLTLTATPSGGSGNYSYQWSGPNGFSSTDQNPVVPNAATIHAGTYTVVLTDKNGCTAEASTVVDIRTGPAQPVVFSTGATCEGGEVVLETTAYTGGQVSYNWTGPNGSTANGDYPNAPFLVFPTASLADGGNYTVQVTVDGCTSEVSEVYVLDVNEAPSVVADNSGADCIAPNTDLTLTASASGGSGVYTYLWVGPNGFSSNEQNPTIPNVSALATGSYTVVITDENGCQALSTTYVSVTTAPNEPMLVYSGDACMGETVTLTASAYSANSVSYQWSGPAGTTASGAYPSTSQLVFDKIDTSHIGTYSVQVIVDGCASVISDTIVLDVHVPPSIAPVAEYTLNADCSPADLLLFANDSAATGSGTLLFTWTGPNGWTSGVQNPVVPNATEVFNGSYTLVVIDENGCSAKASVEVVGITDQVAQPVITGTPQTCEGEAITLSVLAYQGSSVTYTWNVPNATANITGLNSNQITISPATADYVGEYAVTVQVDGCEISSTPYEVLVYSPPTVAVDNDGTDCVDPTSDLNLTATPAGGNGTYYYSWTGPNGFSSNSQTAVVPNVTSAASGTYILVLTDGNGCSAAASTVVNVSTPPAEPTIFAPGPVCEGEEVILQIPAYNGVNVDYEWTGPNGSTLVGTYANANYIVLDTVSALTGGNYTVQVTVDGCTSEISSAYQLVVNEAPDVTLTNDGTECVEPSTDMNLFANVAGSGVYTYEWSGPGGFVSNVQNPIVPNVSSADDGNYTVVVTDLNGCTTEATTTVDVTTMPYEPFVTTDGNGNGSGIFCEGEEITLEAPIYNGVDVFYDWIGPNGSTSNGDYPDLPTFTLPLGDSTNVGNYQVQVTVDGCTSILSTPYYIQVNETPTANPDNNGMPCSIATADLQLTANPTGGVAPFTYQWNGPSGFTSNIANPVLPNVNPVAATGTYTLVLTDANGCKSAVASTVVEIAAMPATPTFVADDYQLCVGENLTLTTTPYNGADVTYNWLLPNGDTVQTDVPSLVIDSVTNVVNNGQYQVSVTVDGCTSLPSADVKVEVTAIPAAPAVPDSLFVCEGEVLDFKTTTVADTYLWTGPNGFVSTVQNPAAITASLLQTAGDYNLVVFENGCPSAVSAFNVEVEKAPAVPILDTELSICEGDTIYLNASNSAGHSYQWIAPSANVNSDFGVLGDPNNPVWTDTSATMILPTSNIYETGTWTVRAVSTNGCKSAVSNAIHLTINGIPMVPPALSNGPVICEGDEVHLIAGPVLGGTYFWYEGNPIDSPNVNLLTTVPNPELYNVPPGTHEYFLMVEVNGCMSDSTSSVKVEVMDMPEVTSVGNSGPYCVGDTIFLNAPTIAGATYYWQGPNGYTAFEEDPIIPFANGGNAGTYQLRVVNGSCNSNPISTQVVVLAQPLTPIVGNNGPVCEGGQVQLSAPTVPNGTFVEFQWTGPNGFLSNLQNPVIDSVSMDDQGNYYLTVVVDGCASLQSAATFVQVLNVPAVPVAANPTTAANPACEGEDVQLQTPYIPGATYTWTGPGGFSATISNPVLEDVGSLDSGTYTVIVEVNGCASGISTTEVFVQPTPNVPIAISDGPVCVGETLTLSVANVDTTLTYTWYDSLTNFLVGTGPELIFPNVQTAQNGAYFVVAEINGCETDPSVSSNTGTDAFATVQVDVPALDQAYVGNDLYACADTVTLNAFQLFTANGQWSNVDPNSQTLILTPNNNSTLVAYLNDSVNVFVWEVISGACGVTSSDTLQVFKEIMPEANDDVFVTDYGVQFDSTVILNDDPNTADFFVELLTDVANGTLELLDNGLFVYAPNPGFIGTEVFEYQICNINCPDRCAPALATIEIGLDAPCEVPSVFTPNGDGVNETFEIPCLPLYPGSDLTIFNRWGDEVFHSPDYQNNWGGTFQGQDLPVGTYFYILKLNDGNGTVYNGYVFLQR